MNVASDAFSGGMAEFYERYVGSVFHPYATDVADRLGGMTAGAVLEVAAGTGIVTEQLARRLPPEVAITATDLSQPMLDFAARRPALGRVTLRQADAMALPFPDASFDVVVCQFGVMFFPDRAKAYAEARRVLRAGGSFLFNVWDSLAHNDFPRCVHETLCEAYPGPALQFIARVPHGYHDTQAIAADLAAGGFATDARLTTLSVQSHARSAEVPATAFCQGTPLRNALEALGEGQLARATELARAALAARYGEGPMEGKIQAHIVEVRR